jgi:two-component system response regulator AtoC
MSEQAKVLVVDDDADMRALLVDGLSRRGFTVVAADGAEGALATLAGTDVDAVVTDVRMRGPDGIELTRAIGERRPGTPVLVVTGFGSLETAVDALRAGAVDFIQKPVEIRALAILVARAVEVRRLRAELVRLRQPVALEGDLGLIGESAPVLRVRELVGQVARLQSNVLITGESGTGKEVVARALHDASPRRDGPFVAVNVSAIPDTLLESQLFGHVKGAFTDARDARPGLFQRASGGTLFLDEVGEMPAEMQPKLLRALQERKVRPVGGDAEVAVDFRLVCATNRDLEEAVADGVFREDLYYRVNVIPIELPPLRARGSDVLLLANHFLHGQARKLGRPVSRLSVAAGEALLSWHWPGNVRELENCIEHAVALSKFDEVLVEDLPPRLRAARHRRGREDAAPAAEGRQATLEEVERKHILAVLAACGGNKQRAAEQLGIGRKTLYRKLAAWNAPGPDPREELDD